MNHQDQKPSIKASTGFHRSESAHRMSALFVVAVLSLASGACTTTSSRSSRLSSSETSGFERLPQRVSTSAYRTIFKAIPYTRERAFHGNYGGSGNRGGFPTDAMDELFRRHDIVYMDTRTLPQMAAADKALVELLKELDPGTMDEDARAYRDRAISFMESPISNVIGKPPSCWIRRKEPDWSPFQSKAEIDAFMRGSGSKWPDLVTNISLRPVSDTGSPE